MKTYLYDSGVTKLAEQDGQQTKLSFTGFKLSDVSEASFSFDAAVNTLPGNVVHTGTIERMYYVPLTQHEAIIQCLVDRDVAEMSIGAVQLLVDSVPFSVSIASHNFIKLATVPDETVGTLYMFQLLMSIPDLLNRFSFANLDNRLATFASYADNDSMIRWAWEEIHDQVVVDNHTQFNAPVFVLNAWNEYWGCPLTAEMNDDDMFWKITGGRVGDDHKYVSEA